MKFVRWALGLARRGCEKRGVSDLRDPLGVNPSVGTVTLDSLASFVLMSV